jgi:lipoprotein-anchoring transpeptidase ErfK/SrfK
MPTSIRHRLAAALLVPLAALAFSACGLTGSQDALDDVDPPPTPVVPLTVPTVPRGPEVSVAPVVSSTSIAARLHGPTEVLAEPSAGADVVTTLDATTELGSAATLLVLEQQAGWLHVSLPIRPNGSSGWIPAEAAELRSTDYVITVDLESRTLTLSEGEAIIVQTPVAIGSDENPTPPGRYFITDLVDTGDAAGAYGPFAFGPSGHSETLTEFGGGDGQLGIHGTNDPSSIGQNVSHGCVRVPNETVAQMVDLVPLGTPVTVV